MAPVRPSSSRTFARVTYSERPVGRRNLRLALEPLERIVDEYSKRGGADGTQRSLPEHGKQKSRPGRCFKPRRGRTERRIWPNPSAIRSRRSPRKIRGRRQPTDYRAIDGQGPLISSAEHAWYRVPPSQDVSPGLVIARFHDQTLEVNQTSVLDISRPFGDLLEHLQRQSEIVKAYFTGIVGGFTMDDGPWWYEILTRPSEGETISPEGQWELLGDVHDYGLLVKRVMLNPNIWSVVFRHVSISHPS